MYKKLATLVAAVSIATSSSAGYLAIGSVVKSVTTTAGGGESFTVVVTGGSGPCVTSSAQVNIYFPGARAATNEIYKRAYQAIMIAAATKAPVNIYNYVDDLCDKAVAVEILPP